MLVVLLLYPPRALPTFWHENSHHQVRAFTSKVYLVLTKFHVFARIRIATAAVNIGQFVIYTSEAFDYGSSRIWFVHQTPADAPKKTICNQKLTIYEYIFPQWTILVPKICNTRRLLTRWSKMWSILWCLVWPRWKS